MNEQEILEPGLAELIAEVNEAAELRQEKKQARAERVAKRLKDIHR
jgi:hypothetical protein